MGSDDSIPRAKKSLKDIIRYFTPAWFAVTMGTGAISIIFLAFPYGTGSTTLRILTLIFFLLNLLLFTVFSFFTFLRYLMFPDIWTFMLAHPVQSLFVATFPMAATTLISVSAGLFVQQYAWGGKSFVYFLWALWWIDLAISVLSCWGMVYWMQVAQSHTLQSMTAAWLLPVVAPIVASSTGNILAPFLYPYSPSHAYITATTSLVSVTAGLTLALMILTINFLRSIVHGLPPPASILTVFLPLGPTGQAGYSILLLGQFFRDTSSHLPDSLNGDVIHVITIAIAFVLWSLATMYLLFALLTVQHVLRRSTVPFKVPSWGLIFPNGVYANLTVALSRTLSSPFFRVFGAVWGGVTILLWVYVAGRTVREVWTRQIFEAPCLEEADIGRNRGKEPELEIGPMKACGSS